VGLAVFLAGAGALFLLRDQQQENARERYGRHAEPLNEQVAARRTLGATLSDVTAYLAERAPDIDARLLLLDEDLLVVYDSAEDVLKGTYIISFENPDLKVIEENGARFKWTDYSGNNDKLTLFTAPPSTAPSSGFEAPEYTVVIAIPQSELATAWLDLAPRLALAGTIALVVSFAVAWFISRSISGPLQRITEASQEMARGNYDVHIPIKGEDEVGRLSEAFNHMAQEVNRSQRMMRDLLANVSH
jgi:HAMP domain-containing protein